MWSAVADIARNLWSAYEALVTPFYPLLQWGIAIGGVLLVLGWGAKYVAAQMKDCPQCGRVIPKRWNPCKMCGYAFERPDRPGPGPATP